MLILIHKHQLYIDVSTFGNETIPMKDVYIFIDYLLIFLNNTYLKINNFRYK